MVNANSDIVRGFSKTKEQAAVLRAHGLPDKVIYLDGRGAETMEACLASFRDRPGSLVVAHDLRLFGPSKRAVADFMAKMELSGIRITDISHPDDKTVAQMIQRANVAISGARFHGDRPRARQQGRAGGIAEGKAAESARSALAPKWLLDRIVDCREIPWAIKLSLLHPHFSESGLRRHFGIHATARKA